MEVTVPGGNPGEKTFLGPKTCGEREGWVGGWGWAPKGHEEEEKKKKDVSACLTADVMNATPQKTTSRQN